MNNIYKYLNIRNVDIEELIKESIKEVKEELNGLDTDSMCQVYTSYIYRKLREKHVVSRIVDTNRDLKEGYSHFFITIPKSVSDCYVIDLTYSQFEYNPIFEGLYNNGYQLLSNEEYIEYIDNIMKSVNRGR